MTKKTPYLLSAPDKVFTDPVKPHMMIYGRIVVWSWFVIYITHIFTWSLFSVDQIRSLGNFGYLAEVDVISADEKLNIYANSQAELMTLMLPFFVINTVLIIGLIWSKIKVIYKRNRNLKHEFPLMFFGILGLYWITKGLLFSGVPIFYNTHVTGDFQYPIWFSAFMKTFWFPCITIIASEFIWNPRSKLLSRF